MLLKLLRFLGGADVTDAVEKNKQAHVELDAAISKSVSCVDDDGLRELAAILQGTKSDLNTS